MKLIIFFWMAALVACDYPTAEPAAPSNSYGAPAADGDDQSPAPANAPFEPTRAFDFKNFYHGAFPPVTLPPNNFLSHSSFPSSSFRYPLRTFGYTPFAPQGILPPISQIIPPISQIVPPISQVVPPVLGGAKPSLPVNPSQVLPPTLFPPSVPPSVLPAQPATSLFSAPHINKYAASYAFPSFYRPLTSYPYFRAPSTFFSPSPFFPSPLTKDPAASHPETPATCYGPPSSSAAESSAPFEPAAPAPAPAETSAPFDPSPVSYPYEPAAPEPEESAPHTPAQEYGLPSRK